MPSGAVGGRPDMSETQWDALKHADLLLDSVENAAGKLARVVHGRLKWTGCSTTSGRRAPLGHKSGLAVFPASAAEPNASASR